ncbi:hypothetical protein CMI38_07145 [Candidatus Pacearchaeota archaeon]|jgi:hypothetical protein|nr:hypothetical protein [Candidatus Pacearchaeota archaeon]|tara:strand:+ start:164 stop:448 length:285 start_codon:yes stop_codon:yes gene_type:complete
MEHVIEINDKSGREIGLTERQWKHIRHKHLDVNELMIEETFVNPLNIIIEDEGVAIYYRYFKDKDSNPYLKVMVKYLNGDGYVITSYFVKGMLK